MSRTRVSIPDACPRFPPHVRLRWDAVRARWVLLAPERVFLPNESAVEVLKRIDGERTVQSIVEELAAVYAAPEEVVATDVVELVADFLEARLLRCP